MLRSVLLFIFFAGTGLTECQVVPGDSLKFPWAGGLNSCQVGEIDLNLDGVPDLVVFDRFGNRILPFIYDGPPGEANYSYHPEYAPLFPDLHDWAEFVDYNCDGKKDIFTYGLGGIRVFENVSDTSLKFRLVTSQVTSYYYTGYVGILLTPVDFPAIADIDGDGDLDILTFFGLGSYIEYHKNLSMEKYGTCDSLDYKLTDKCWGDIKESEGSNKLTLDIACPYKYDPLPSSCTSGPPKHTGSTLLVTDLNGDGVMDLILGDVDFPDLISLINGGTRDSAHMISQDTLFPSYNRPVDLFSFVDACKVDIDHDGIDDLVVSSFDPNYYIAENTKSAWYYRNYGTNSVPDYRFISPNLFQGDMIDVGTWSLPVLEDLRGTGLPDLFVGNYGNYDSSWYSEGVLHSAFTSRISWYRNEGTPLSPRFHLVTDDLGNFSSLRLTGLYPAFGDLNGDGIPDLLAGNSDGTLYYFRNTGTADQPSFAPPVANYQGIDAGDFSAPQLFDLDRDGLPDLIIGEQNGNLNYYRNTGTAGNPVFTYVTDSLGRINVTDYNYSYYGFSAPCFFRTPSGETRLLVGSDDGTIHYYTGIDGNLGGKFHESDSLWSLISQDPFTVKCGWRTAPAIAHLTDPVAFDLIAGNFSGGLNYFTGAGQPKVYTSVEEPGKKDPEGFRVYPNPAKDHFYVESQKNPVPGFIQVSLYNSFGQKILLKTFHDSRVCSIDVSDIPAGIYLVQILTNDDPAGFGISNFKIVILN